MRVRVLVLIFLSLVPSFAEEKKETGSPETALAVIMSFDEPYSRVTVEEMEKEAGAILRSCPLQIAWRVLDESVPRESFNSLIVARFRGGCRALLDEPPLRAGALGITHVSDGAILPFADIDCTKIRRYLQPELRELSQERSDRALGRALGRVLSHEVYHIVAKTRRHSARGVAKAFLSSQELLKGRLGLEREETDLIRKAMAARVRPASPAHPNQNGGQETVETARGSVLPDRGNDRTEHRSDSRIQHGLLQR